MSLKITIRTTDELNEALNETKDATDRKNISEVIRDGMEFYDLIVQRILQGKRIYIGDCRETAGEVLLPHLERARRRSTSSSEGE